MSRPPLIVHVIHHLRMGGLENGLVNLINRMPAERYRHCVMCIEDFSDFRDRIERPDVEVIAMHRSTLSMLQLYRRIYESLKTRRPAIVHSRNLSGLDALFPAFLARVPLRIQSEHGWDVDDLKGAALKPRLLRRLHSPLVDRYVTVSRNLERYLVDGVGVSSSRITQIYNGVDTARFSPAAFKPSGVMPPDFYGHDRLVFGTVGRLQAVKDQETLLRATGTLLRAQPALRQRVRLAIVGEGPKREALQACAQQEQIADILWLPGSRNDTSHVYQCLDVFVLPSLNEGISNTLLEAMATGLPVVATAVGGNPELVENDTNGQLVKPSTIQELARALQVYVLDDARRARHGVASRARAITAFSLDAMVKSYTSLYDQRSSTTLP